MAGKDYKTLKEISNYNNGIVSKYDYDAETAISNGEKVFMLDDTESGQLIFDVFMDSTYRFETDPYKEYKKEDLDRLIKEWKER